VPADIIPSPLVEQQQNQGEMRSELLRSTAQIPTALEILEDLNEDDIMNLPSE
jgi:hypothetical protein